MEITFNDGRVYRVKYVHARNELCFSYSYGDKNEGELVWFYEFTRDVKSIEFVAG